MAVPPSPSFPFKPPKSPVLEKFAFFKGRKTNNTVVAHSPTSSRSPRSPTSPMSSNLDLVRSNTLEPPTPTTPGMQMHFIEPGGRGIVPQTDAPQCASNGGLRRVIVMCRGMTVELEVKLLTTTIDILSACSDQMPQSFNINTSMLIEAYNQLGLERRIRRYEHIRDIMNSWDRDNLNALVVAPDTPESDPDLDFDNAPRGEHSPPGFILPLYHSQRPGKWNKRFITLLEGGQMFASKKADPTPVDKDVQGLCHLSDFDIYIPNEAQTKKLLKPPKKYCYAIKSQQTTAVFLNSENFVHFFCTDDPNIAQKLHSHVHSWRSWYLVTKLLQIEAKKKEILAEPPPKLPDPVKHKPKKSVSHVKINGHKVKVSVDESPYAIGAFAPLLDLGRFEKPLDEFGKDWVPDRNSVLPPVKPLQPSASIKKAAPTEKEQEFAAKGLLGDGYEERKQAKKAESNEESVEGPFTEGPNLLNGGIPAKAEASEEEAPKLVEPEKEKEQEKKPEPSSWFPSALEHSTKKKESEPPRPSTSAGPSSQLEREREREQRRQQQGQRKPGPLISLNPKVAESRAREGLGLGRGVPVPEGLLAVQLATGPATPTNSRFLAVPNRSAVRTKGSSSSSSSSSSQQQQKQPRQPHHQQSQSHHQQQRPSTSDGPRNMPRRPTVNGTSRRGDPGDLPPLPPLPPSNLHNRAATRDGAYDPGFPLPPSNRPSTSAGHRPSDRDYQRPSTSAGHRPQERDQSRPGTSAGHRPSERDHSRPRGGPEHGLRVPPRMANQQQQRGRSGSIMI
ncbi:hypothetical protein QBC46DRAFT_250409 [Diplogelasinospora grovesii]|uniref:PH domain-containing protein n=1 Tax=Diplogelasinospora grovesii TaxID=303347 RepID=A0AAN6S9N8_9PEZI|nr:hypothetical protein QBC46DRAFT_250409 [Diplogelasinospora grovesii]